MKKLAVMVLVLAAMLFAPAALAANGDGVIEKYSPGAVTVSDGSHDIKLTFYNDATDTTCIDEIIITPPATWTGTATLSSYTNLDTTGGPATTVTNEADDGTFSGLTPNSQSLRIVPGNSICRNGRVELTISGLVAPANPEDSVFMIMTSDQLPTHNEPSSSWVRQPLDSLIPGMTPAGALPIIRVTQADSIKLEYVQINGYTSGTAPAEYTFTGTGRGAMGRLDSLYLSSSASGVVNVYLDKTGNGVLDTAGPNADYLLTPVGFGIVSGINTIPLAYTTSMDRVTVFTDGYIYDGVSTRFFIDTISGVPVLSIAGHTDVPADATIDTSISGSGFETTTAIGTVINVGSPTRRTIKLQIVRTTTDVNGSTILADVKDNDIPVYFTTDLSTFFEAPPMGVEGTDVNGEVELKLNPGTKSGLATIDIMADWLATAPEVTEYVGIAPGAPVSWKITKGTNGTQVTAGDLQTIETTVYDQYGNIISNNPSRPAVDFTLLSAPATDACVDDDVSTGCPSNSETENTWLGIADAELLTSKTIGNHVVQVCVTKTTLNDMGCKTTTIIGVMGAPYQIVVTTNQSTMRADGCIDALVEVTDKYGNRIVDYKDPYTGHIQQWESLVGVEIQQPLESRDGSTSITKTNLREEKFVSSYRVQGKLTKGAGTVTVCGCQGLGQFDIVATSDTLNSGTDTVDVTNARPECVNVDLLDKDNELLSCENSVGIDVWIQDTCGNAVIDQSCSGGGQATSCVNLSITQGGNLGHLSTDSVCVDLEETGHAPMAWLYRDSASCGNVQISAFDAPDCCPNVYAGSLPMCNPISPITFVGAPVNITSEFEAERNSVKIPDMKSDIVSEPIYDTFYVVDACKNIVSDFNGEVDVQLKGEDCVSFIEVDSPADLNDNGQYCEGTPSCGDLTSQGQALCQNAGCTWNVDECTGTATSDACDDFTFDQCWETINDDSCDWLTDSTCELDDEKPVFKLVVDNCATSDKQWTDLKKNDIMVDKLAFTISAPNYDFDVEIWQETELEPGFQASGPNADLFVGRAPANNIYDDGAGNAPQGLTVAELRKTIPYFGADWYSRGTEEDGEAGPEREGGVLVRAGNTTDFYVVLDPDNGDMCGVYDVNFAFYQDYTNADIIDNEFSGYGEDYDLGRDDHNYIFDGVDSRNEFYQGEEYGFGDKFLNNLDFSEGTAWIKFRDLTAETVKVWSSDVQLRGEVCNYQDKAELGTCYVRNSCSGPLMDDVTAEDCQDVRGESWRSSDTGICSDLPQEDMSLIGVVPNPETITFSEQLATQVVMINHDGFDAKSVGICTVDGSFEFDYPQNAFLVNLQTADGFQNPHAKALPVTLDSCLAWEFFDFDETGEQMIGNGPLLSSRFDWDNDHCVDKEEFRAMLEDGEIFEEFADYFHEVLFADFFGSEFTAWIDNYFTNAKVDFYDLNGNLLPGNQILTDANGQAQFYAASKYAGFYRITSTPYALDADYTFVNFKAGIPESLDIISVPGFGVPADGEQEAMLWVRALDSCGNIIEEDIDNVTVTAKGSKDNQVVISEDFNSENNYDNNVTGTLEFAGGFLGKWFGADKTLRVLDDFPETATIKASKPGLKEDTTTVVFQGAPVKLEIVSITPSDRLPADGVTGAWLTVEVQDILGNRVTGYLGGGFAGDPDDPFGLPDYRFEEICIDLDDADASIPSSYMDVDNTRFGIVSISPIGPSRYCFDILFGRGSLYITHENPDNNHGGRVEIEIWDALPWQGQEINENGLPANDKTTQLDRAFGSVDFVDPATKWDITSDQQVVLADGVSAAKITVQIENDFMDVRAAVAGSVYVGGTSESGIVVSWNGEVDELNPAKARVLTDPITGNAMLFVTSTEPGTAEITVVGGDAYVCDPPGTTRITWLNPDLLDPLFEKEYEDCVYSETKDLTPETITIEFLEVADNQISIAAGWNFISVPFELNNSPTLGALFPAAQNFAVWNESTQNWAPSPQNIVVRPLNGYWVYNQTPFVVNLTYASVGVQTPPTKNVVAGWNTVGLSLDSPMVMENALISIDPKYTSVIDWNEMIQRYALPVANVDGVSQFTTGGATMEPKQGYWIWVTSPGMLQGWAV